MAKIKSTPNLPASSRMQMPSGNGGNLSGMIKETGGMKAGSSKGTASKIVAKAKGKGMTKKGGY